MIENSKGGIFRNEPYFEEAVRKHLCSQCEHFDADGVCHVTEPRGCPLFRDLPQMVMEDTLRYLDSRWPIIFEGREIPFKAEELRESCKVMGALIDITERKAIEEALRESKEKLKETGEELSRSNKELEQFASIVSHDLKSPLRNIQVFSERLEGRIGDKLDDTAKEYFRKVQENALRMTHLIEDLLQYSTVTTKSAAFEEIDLNALVRETLSDLEAIVVESKAEIVLENLPKITADKFQMKQLFQNLIANALKYRKKTGFPRVRIYSQESEEGFVEIRVEDNGIGFEMKYRDKIFQPFQRLHGKGEYEGSGIGLALCQKVIAHHNGQITAESVPGVGSTFIIKFLKVLAPIVASVTDSSLSSA